MALNAESSLPLQKETTDKKRKPMAIGQFFRDDDDEDKKAPKAPSITKDYAVQRATDLGDAGTAREMAGLDDKISPMDQSVFGYNSAHGNPTMDSSRNKADKPLPRPPLKPKAKPTKRKSIGEMIAEG